MLGSIISLKARQVLDSRGNPTIETEVHTKKGVFKAIVPSGASTGKYEAVELRDNKKAFFGKTVLRAVKNVNQKIAPELIDFDVLQQKEIDSFLCELDGTKNKSKLGANAILSVSLAICRAGAAEAEKPLYKYIAELSKNKKLLLPIPLTNVINGGLHAGNDLNVQEFMLFPNKAKSFSEAIQICAETYQQLKKVIMQKFGKSAVNVGDEGGFAPPLKKTEQAIELILKALRQLGYEKKVNIAIDSAASEFFKKGVYSVDGKKFSAEKLIDYYIALQKKFPIVSFEDPFAQDDWKAYCEFMKVLGKKVQIVGDDLLVTNTERIEKAVELNACNALLLKVNQIGTLSEAIDAAALAVKNTWNVIVSHRSGDTEDVFIADLAVGIGCGQIKSGATCRSERNAKYNQLLRIEEDLKGKAFFKKMMF